MVKSKRFTEVALGETFSIGLTDTGHLMGWGKGFAGEESQSNVPVPIPLPEDAPAITKVYAGAKHAAAIDADGQVLTWGFGGSWFKGGGQLGHGDTAHQEAPAYVEAFREYVPTNVMHALHLSCCVFTACLYSLA
jgi:alpha-tubulin suppressor-like RCC1 family protein